MSFALFTSIAVMAAQPFFAETHHDINARKLRSGPRTTYIDRAAIETRRTESKELIRDVSLASVTADAWRWYVSLPTGIAGDTSGVNCGVAQDGPFWFLAPPLGTNSSTPCVIPAGKTIVAFVAGAAYLSNNCPGDFDNGPVNAKDLLGDFATPIVDSYAEPKAELDSQRLRVRRVVTDVFSFTAGDDWVKIPDGCFTGSPQIGVSDGYFVFIPPLPRGDHTLTMTLADPFTHSVFNLKIR